MIFKNTHFNNEKYTSISPVQFGFQTCDKGYFFGPAIRTYWVIHYVESGEGKFRIKNKEYKLRVGDMFVIPPFIETYYEADKENPWSYIWVAFNAENLPAELDDVIRLHGAQSIFTELKTADRYQNGRGTFVLSKIWELFALLLYNEPPETNYVSAALNIIRTEYAAPLTVESIAKRIGLDRRYFSFLFKKETGSSPKQALTSYRMEIAAMMLLKNNSVSVVSNSVGYTDLFQFSKMFKSYFGVSPTEYRKK